MNILCIGVLSPSTPNTVFKTHSTIRCNNTPVAYQTFTHQIWWVVVFYDQAYQIRWAKHAFSGRCDFTAMVCCSFGGHSTPQFLQCITRLIQSSTSMLQPCYKVISRVFQSYFTFGMMPSVSVYACLPCLLQPVC